MRQRESCWLYDNAAATTLVALGLFVVVALLVVAGDTTRLDQYANNLAAGWRVGVPDLAAIIATTLGTAPFLLGAAVISAVLMARHGLRSEMVLPFLALAAEWIANPLLKEIFLRQRPNHVAWPPGLFGVDQYAFPSGHAMGSMALYSLLAFWAWAWWPGRGRLAITLLMVLMPLAIGLSRVVLGVHWLSDVAGGWAAGFMVTSLAVQAWMRLRRKC
jgi:membrane-associated phospholipid phosphatase